MDELLQLYPNNVTLGSPYDTGTQNALTPEFKRMASILGDIVFQSPRRYFLKNASDKQNAWSYCTSHMFFPSLRAHAVLLFTHFSHSKQALQVAAFPWLGSRDGHSEYLWRWRPDGLPSPIYGEHGSQWRSEPTMAAVYHLVFAINDLLRRH